jgi:alkylhydroperoxidase/carboxymuconolactone decarboxylase family protein YurZ
MESRDEVLLALGGGDWLSESPLKILEKFDPDLLKLVDNTSKFALADGSLPRKFKFLIAMSLDASHGAVQGVRSLAQAARQAGATREEIMEALRVVQYVSGVGSVYTAALALRELRNSIE